VRIIPYIESAFVPTDRGHRPDVYATRPGICSSRGRHKARLIPGREQALLIAFIVSLNFADSSWAVLAKLVRHEIRITTSGDKVLVCIYAAGDREVERVYPAGNFCPQYTDL